MRVAREMRREERHLREIERIRASRESRQMRLLARLLLGIYLVMCMVMSSIIVIPLLKLVSNGVLENEGHSGTIAEILFDVLLLIDTLLAPLAAILCTCSLPRPCVIISSVSLFLVIPLSGFIIRANAASYLFFTSIPGFGWLPLWSDLNPVPDWLPGPRGSHRICECWAILGTNAISALTFCMLALVAVRRNMRRKAPNADCHVPGSAEQWPDDDVSIVDCGTAQIVPPSPRVS